MYRVGPSIIRLLPLSLLMASLFSGAATAQWSASQRDRLAVQIETASKNIDASRFPKLDQTSVLVKSSVAATEGFFQRQVDATNAEAWLKYLKMEPLKDAIEADDSAASLAREAIDLRYRLVGTAPGLEVKVLQKLRQDLEQLIEAIRLRDPERAETLLSRQMVALAEKVREMDDNPSAEDVSNLNAVVGLLDASGQAVDVVRSFRDHFSRPNLAFLVGESMVQSAVNRGVNQNRPINDCILGTRIIGQASLNGVITANLLPSIGDVRVEVSLTGNVGSRNTGYNGPVRLQTSGCGNVHVSRTLHISESGITADVAMVQASLITRIDAIEHNLRLVRRIANKKAAEQKPNADRIAVEKLRTQVGSQFVEQTDTAIAVSPPDVMANIRPVLKRLSLDEPSRFWGSTDDQIYIDSTLRRRDQLSSVVSRPTIFDPFEAAVQIHESAIDNAMSPFLAGRTMKEGDFEQLVANTGFPVDASARAKTSKTDSSGSDYDDEDEDDELPFEIEFARLRPIIFEARDQTVRLGVRGVRFSQGKRELKQAMEITAVYQPAKTADGKAILIRQDDVDVSFPGPGKRLSVSQAGLKRTIQKKFANVFPEVLLDQSVTVPATAQVEALRGRVFRPELLDSQNGWLTVGVGSMN